ncbi:MAG: ATP-binding protein [Cupriavidus sp.]|nr:ATP-binding protein [Cupriavidus sp.]
MKEKIKKILEEKQPQRAKEIARRLNSTSRDINRILHANSKDFVQAEDCSWSLAPSAELVVAFPSKKWLSTSQFEAALTAVESPLESALPNVVFKLAPDTRILLEVTARLLALCNQLVDAGKSVTIDFRECRATSAYLNRVGFYDLLDPRVIILPLRPAASTARALLGGNSAIVEVAKIDLQHRDNEIPRRLYRSLAEHLPAKTPLHTILGELFDNIHEHSSSPIPGFVALQCYKSGNDPHISAVFSDNGSGIVGTLMPTLDASVVERLAATGKREEIALIEAVFSGEQLSRMPDEGRGLGLKLTGSFAQKFNGSIIVRQETFEVTMRHAGGKRTFTSRTGLRKMRGTHICVKISLTQ